MERGLLHRPGALFHSHAHRQVPDQGKDQGCIPESFEILATDISHSVLETAKAGKYDDVSISRGLDLEYRSRYFSREGKTWVLDKGIRDRVEFKQFNLQNNFVALGRFDAVFCRYVTIYFSPGSEAGDLQEDCRSPEPALWSAFPGQFPKCTPSMGIILQGSFIAEAYIIR